MPSSERMLISAILLSGDNSFVKQEGLSQRDFISHKVEFDYIIQNGVPSRLMFKKQFPDFKVVKGAEAKDIPQLVTMVRTDRVRHEFHRAIEKVLNQVDEKPPMDLAKKLRDSMDKITGMYQVATDRDILNNTKFIEDDYKRRVRMNKEGKQTGIPTSIPTIDKETGGLAPEELWVIVGRQGDGKTWLSLEFCVSANLHGKKVLYISLEMSPELIGYRYHTLMYALRHPKKKQNQFSNLELMRGQVNLKRYRQFLQRIKESYKTGFVVPELGGNFIFTTSTVAAKIEEHHPDVVVIDYIGLMQSDSAKGKIENWQEVSQMIRELKTLAMSKNICIIVNAQANRAAAEGREAPKLHHIANSDAIGATADRVISLRMMPSGTLRVSIEKNRFGRQSFFFDVKWNINHGFMHELKKVDLEGEEDE